MPDTPRTSSRRAKAAIGLAASALVLGGIGVAGAVTGDEADTGSSTVTSDETSETTAPDPSVETSDTTDTSDPGDEGDASELTEEEPAVEGEVGELPGPDDNFGQWVSAQAREGGVDGQEISAAAHARNEARKAAREDGVDADEDDDDTSGAAAHAGPPASNPGKGKGSQR
jgi:hypothetical protein